jgi:acetoin utilization protein AcuC
MREVVLLASTELWEHGHGPAHPLKPERLQRTYELLEAYEAFDTSNVKIVSPRPATPDELTLFHTEEYIAAVQALSQGKTVVPASRFNFGPGDNPVFDGMYDSERLKVGSALLGAELLLNGECEVTFSYGGGLHHAGSSFASGFCVFNDAAIAIHWLLRQGQRVAYVDIDVHHGDGVQDAFYDEKRVLTISVHQDGHTLFPGTGHLEEVGRGPGRGYNANLPLPPYCDDESYLWAFEEVVPPLLARFEADIVVTQLGVDTHYLDPLASLALTTHGQTAVFEALSRLSPLWLALGGGGYNLDVVPRAWTMAFGVMSEQNFPDKLPYSYRKRYGGEWLQDRQKPQIDSSQRQMMQDATQAAVERFKQIHF